jgi:hypothetical protein
MGDPLPLFGMALAAITAILIAAAAVLKGWQGWLELKRLELDSAGPAAPPAAARIELADLKERVRRLEAIASGIE